MHQITWVPGRANLLLFLVKWSRKKEKYPVRITLSSRTGQPILLYGDLAKKNTFFYRTSPSGYFWKVFVFQKIFFKVEVLKTFKISTYCHMKTWKTYANLANVGLFLKSLKPFFRRIYTLFFPVLKDKNQPKLCRKTCWKEQSFIFIVYLMNHIFQTSVLFSTW